MQLIYMFPEDYIDNGILYIISNLKKKYIYKKELLFWTGVRRFPNALKFNLND